LRKNKSRKSRKHKSRKSRKNIKTKTNNQQKNWIQRVSPRDGKYTHHAQWKPAAKLTQKYWMSISTLMKQVDIGMQTKREPEMEVMCMYVAHSWKTATFV